MAKKSNSTHAIPYGLHGPSQRMVRATEVGRGRTCDCVCASCGVRLKTRQGEHRVWHFAHDEDTTCRFGAETAIHQMAKQWIAECAKVYVPSKPLSRTVFGKRRVWSETLTTAVQKSGLVRLEDCEVEKTVWHQSRAGEQRRPDVRALLDGRPVAIEIRNTHAVDGEKLEWLKGQGYSVLEISVGDLGALPIDQLHEALEKRLFEASLHTVWLAHARESEALAELDRLEVEARRRWQDRERALIAKLDAEAARQRRNAEFLKRVRDVEDFKLRVGQCTVRIGRNQDRVSLKVHGFAEKPVFDAVRDLARRHRGQFNGKGRCWEFHCNGSTEALFCSLREELRQGDWFGRPVEIVPVLRGAVDRAEAPPSGASSESRWVPFADPDRLEAYEERAAILEFDAGLSREEAEQRAWKEVVGRGHLAGR